MFFSHLPKDGIADETIKLAHHLAQTPSAYRNVSQNLEIEKCMNKLIQLKDSGAIGGCPCNLGTCWTFQKSEIEKHFIGNISGSANQFRVFGDIICEGTAPSMHEAIVGINRSLGTILGSMESMIEVPHDVCEHLNYSPMFEYSRAWITSRYELIYGLKNAENKLGLFSGNPVSRKTGYWKTGAFPGRMFVDGKVQKTFRVHRFGQMCFTTNRDKDMWRASDSDHINGDKFDNRKTNTRWLDGIDNNKNYHNGQTLTEALWVNDRRNRHAVMPPMTMKGVDTVTGRPRARRWKTKPPIVRGRPPITRTRPPIMIVEDEHIALGIRTVTAIQNTNSRWGSRN
jgi:hypothetical protein